VGICKEYVIALRCELKRKELKEDDMARAAELAAYFTHCNLQVGWARGGGGALVRDVPEAAMGGGRSALTACMHRTFMPGAVSHESNG
jgi:hypothetical protein